MEKSDFDRLLQRYLSGHVSEQERIKIEAWLDVMKTEDTADLELSKEDEDKLFQKITGNLDNVEEIVAFRPGKEKKLSVNQWILRIAATLLIVSLVSYGIWYVTENDDNRLQVVSRNGVEKIILNDGSLVWLRGKSKLVYYEKPDEGIRYSELEGEALFEVTKDASRPFIIKCGEVDIKVLGTSFSIRTSHDSLELSVLTGKVNLSSPTNNINIDVEPNEKAIYKGNGEIEKLSLDKKEVSSITANTEYNMLFTNTTMGDVIENLEEKFNVRIRLDNNDIRRCRITADFTDHSLEKSLQMITEVLNVEYTQKGNIINFSGSGCK